MSEVEQNTAKASRNKKGQPSAAGKFNPDEHEKKCPDCAEYIKLEARVCKHCGHEFSDEEVEQQIEEIREIRRDGEEQRGEKPMLYCERSEISVQPNLDGTTCPACGKNIDDRRHPTLEEASE